MFSSDREENRKWLASEAFIICLSVEDLGFFIFLALGASREDLRLERLLLEWSPVCLDDKNCIGISSL